MAVKRKNEKKNRINNLYENGKLIKCCYCEDKDTCRIRVNKEHSEGLGIKTYCTLSPNKVKKNTTRR